MRVLVVCTGNSCRSIMAEGLLNARGNGRVDAFSAGSTPAGYVHPKSLSTLARHGIEHARPSSQSWDVYADQAFDYVITVCDNAAAETCPVFQGDAKRLHWSTPDPASASGSDAEVDAVFDSVFDQLGARVDEFLNEQLADPRA